MTLIYTRKTIPQDVDDIVNILHEAKKFLAKKDSSQWQDGYPNRQTIEDDIKNDCGQTLIVDDQVAGYTAAITGIDPTYVEIEGSWLNDDDPYTAIHRVAVGQDYRGMHLASFLLSDIISIYRADGIKNFRIDTSTENEIVQHLATEHGFSYRGKIEVETDPDNPHHLAYELNLK